MTLSHLAVWGSGYTRLVAKVEEFIVLTILKLPLVIAVEG